jgi:hypothetical protein
MLAAAKAVIISGAHGAAVLEYYIIFYIAAE